jgi:uncharacterized protein
MSHHAAITCPNCNSTDCRKSHWHSQAERRRYRSDRPYRCRECSHRFHAPDPSRPPPRIAIYAAVALFAIVLTGVVAITVPPTGGDDLLTSMTEAAPVPIDPYTLRAAQEGDPDAQLRIARALLLEGVRDRSRSAEAVGWLQSAAEKDHAAAMVELGKLYRSGFGVLQDFELAAKWIGTAADRGDAEGMLELGRLYRDGIGFQRDPVRAYVWFNRAAAAMHMEAVRDRDDVARGFTPDQLRAAQTQSSGEKTPAVAAVPVSAQKK